MAGRTELVTLDSADLKSLVVTCLVCSSVHFTSRVNSTEQSGQKSEQVQSLRRGRSLSTAGELNTGYCKSYPTDVVLKTPVKLDGVGPVDNKPSTD